MTVGWLIIYHIAITSFSKDFEKNSEDDQSEIFVVLVLFCIVQFSRLAPAWGVSKLSQDIKLLIMRAHSDIYCDQSCLFYVPIRFDWLLFSVYTIFIILSDVSSTPAGICIQ